MKKLILIFLILTGCASNQPSPTPNLPGGFLFPALAWKTPEWDSVLYEEIENQKLPDVASLHDSPDYCPKYSSLTRDQRKQFWGTLLVAIAKRESGYDPKQTYPETFKDAQGRPVISTGLFQISQESASSPRYGCGKMTTEGLKVPKTNIICSTKIIARWVKEHEFAGTTLAGEQKGCAKYFSTCRNGTTSRAYITERTRALEFCK